MPSMRVFTSLFMGPGSWASAGSVASVVRERMAAAIGLFKWDLFWMG
jgi:hypothetical protein